MQGRVGEEGCVKGGRQRNGMEGLVLWICDRHWAGRLLVLQAAGAVEKMAYLLVVIGAATWTCSVSQHLAGSLDSAWHA